MALKKTGIIFETQGLSKYISDLDRAGDANLKLIKSGAGVGNIDSALGDAGRRGAGAFGIAFAAGIGSAIGSAVIDAVKFAAEKGLQALQFGFDQAKLTIGVGIEFQQNLADIEADLTNLNPSLAPGGIFDPATAARLAGTINQIALDPKLVVGFSQATAAAKTLTRYSYNLDDIAGGALRSTVLLQNAVGGSFDLAAETLAKYAAINKVKPGDLPKAVSEISATISQGGYRDLNDYRYALVNSTGAAQAFGVSAEDMNVILAASNHQFSSGRTAGTGIRTLFEKLVPSSDKAKDAMQDLGLSFFDAKGNYVGFAETIKRLRGAFDGTNAAAKKLTQEQRELYIQEIFGATAGREVRLLLSDLTDEYLAHTRAVITSADAEQAAAVRTNTLGTRLGNLGDQFEALRAKFAGNDLLAILTGPVEAFSSYIGNLGPLAEQAGKNVAAYLAPASDAFTEIINNLANTGDIGNFSFALGPVRVLRFNDLYALDIGSFQFAVSQGFQDVTINLGDVLKFNKTATKTELKISDFFTVAEDTLTGAVNLKIGTFSTSFNIAGVEDSLKPFLDYLSGIPGRIAGVITGQLDITTLFPQSASDALDNVSTGLKTFGGAVTLANLALQAVTAPGGGLAQVRAWVTGTADSLGQALSKLDPVKTANIGLSISGTLASVVNLLTTLANIGGDNLSAATNSILSVSTGLINFTTGIVKGLDAKQLSTSAVGFVSGFIDQFTKILSSPQIPGFTDAASNFVFALSTKFKEALAPGQLTDIGKSIGTLGNTLLTQLTAILSDKQFAGNIGTSLANLATGLVTGITDIIDGATKAADPNAGAKLENAFNTFGVCVRDALVEQIKQTDWSVVGTTLRDAVLRGLLSAFSNTDTVFGQGLKTFSLLGDALAKLKGGDIAGALYSFADAEEAAKNAVENLTPGLRSVDKAGTALVQKGVNALVHESADTPTINPTTGTVLLAQPPSQAAPVQGPPKPVQVAPVQVGGNVLDLARPNVDTGPAQIGAQNVTAQTVTVTTPNALQSTGGFGGDNTGQNGFTALIEKFLTATAAPAYAADAQTQNQVYLPYVANADQLAQDTQAAVQTAQSGATNAPHSLADGLGSVVNTLTAAATASAASMTTGASAFAATLSAFTMPSFPGWAQFVQPVNLAAYVSPLHWSDFITGVNLSSQQSSAPSSTKLIGFAKGTRFVPRTASYLVGEHGPELATLSRGMGVIPAAQTRSILSSYALTGDTKRYATSAIPPLSIGAPQLGPQMEQQAQRLADAQKNAATATERTAKNTQDLNEQVGNVTDSTKLLNMTIQDIAAGLKKVPGLFGTTSVTPEDMAAAKAGTYKDKADEFLRQLQDQVEHHVDYGTDLVAKARNAITNIGETPVADDNGLVTQIRQLWASGQLFSNKANIPDLVNANAVQQSLLQQQAEAQGQQNLMDYFTQMFGGAAASALGATGLPAAQGDRRRKEDQAQQAGTGGSNAGTTGANNALGIPAFPGWTGKDGIIPPFPVWISGKDGGIIPGFPGWSDQNGGFIPDLNWADFIDPLNAAAKTASTQTAADASGTTTQTAFYGNGTAQPQTNVVARPAAVKVVVQAPQKNYHLNVNSQQPSGGIARDFQYMQVTAG